MKFRDDARGVLTAGFTLALALAPAACSNRVLPDPIGMGGSGGGGTVTGTGGNGGSGPVVHTEADTAAMRVAIDAYIDQRFEAPAGATDELIALLDKGQFTLAETEAILRGSRASYAAPAGKIGQIGEFDITCYHVDYSSIAYLKVPVTYDAAKPTALIIVGHGGNSSMSKDYARAPRSTTSRRTTSSARR